MARHGFTYIYFIEPNNGSNTKCICDSLVYFVENVLACGQNLPGFSSESLKLCLMSNVLKSLFMTDLAQNDCIALVSDFSGDFPGKGKTFV